MIKSAKILILLFFLGFIGWSQEPKIITLPLLYDAIEKNSPVSAIKPHLESATNLQIKNISTTYLPKLDLNASASWQSDVTAVSIPSPGMSIPSPDPDQYRFTLDIAQIIWDGGSTPLRKSVANAQLEVDKSSIQSELYGLRDRVNDAFFSLALIDISIKQLNLMKDELNTRLESMNAGVREGVILPSSTFSLKAEILRLEQKIIELPLRKVSLLNQLESLTQLKFSTSDVFSLPSIEDAGENEINRPELLSFASQKTLLDTRSELIGRKRMPMVSGFLTSGLGKPGLNMLSNDWDTHLIAGARITWNIWDWNVTKREREQLMIQKQVIDLRQQTFEQGIESGVVSSENQIETISKQLTLDKEIVDLLEQVKSKSASQLSNGVISSTEYLTDFNAASRAMLDMEYRKLLLIKEKVKLKYLLGGRINDEL
jgi:outer membrane protein TolC